MWLVAMCNESFHPYLSGRVTRQRRGLIVGKAEAPCHACCLLGACLRPPSYPQMVPPSALCTIRSMRAAVLRDHVLKFVWVLTTMLFDFRLISGGACPSVCIEIERGGWHVATLTVTGHSRFQSDIHPHTRSSGLWYYPWSLVWYVPSHDKPRQQTRPRSKWKRDVGGMA